MVRPLLAAALLGAGALLLLRALAGDDVAGTLRLPAPVDTLHVLDEDAEEENAAGRREWIEGMHRAAPGVDWRAIEAANGRAEMARRRQLARAGVLGPGGTPWSEVGSSNQAGRMHCAVVGPDGLLYAGSSLGGLWRGALDGSGWTPLGDNLFGGVHELLVAPGANAGDPPAMVAATDGGDVHVSSDGGASWSAPAGLGSLANVRAVAQLDDAAHTLLVYGQDGSGGSQRPAVFASTDRGATFVQRWRASQNHPGGMWVPRTGAGAAADVYVVHRGQLLYSNDGGWSFATRGTIASGTSRARLCGSEAGAPRLYAFVQTSSGWELHRSDDAGFTWSLRQSGLGDYWEAQNASIVDPDVVAYGGVECWRSTDGGQGFSQVNTWGSYYGDPANRLHADMMGMYSWPHPTTPGAERWYVATDGGLYHSDDRLASVHNLSLSGLGVSQYYSTHTSTANPLHVLAGAQDQGYQRGIFQAPTGSGPSTPFDQLISGDYGHLTSGDGSHAFVYSTYPGFILVQKGENNPALFFEDFPVGSNQLWLPPVVADPLDNQAFFFLGDRLHRYHKAAGNVWPDVQHTAYDFLASGGSFLTAMAFARSDPQRVYAANDAGRLFASTDHGLTWTQSASSAPPEHYFYGNALAVHPNDPDEAVVAGSGYSGAGVRRTVDGGATWTALDAGLPNTLVYDIVYALDGTGDLYAGTETGAWHWDRTTGTWSNLLFPDTPITIYWSVEVVDAGQTIRFGTYGRGIWDYDVGYTPPPPPVAVCPGDGSVAPCPCGNTGTANTGCRNSGGAGAAMSYSGTSRVAFDDLRLVASQAPYFKNGVFLQGATTIAQPFRDGLLCVGNPTERLEFVTTNTVGLAETSVSIVTEGHVSAGQTRTYQFWYRDGMGPCSNGSNLTNALEVSWN